MAIPILVLGAIGVVVGVCLVTLVPAMVPEAMAPMIKQLMMFPAFGMVVLGVGVLLAGLALRKK